LKTYAWWVYDGYLGIDDCVGVGNNKKKEKWLLNEIKINFVKGCCNYPLGPKESNKSERIVVDGVGWR
jgi:hypothetical protein